MNAEPVLAVLSRLLGQGTPLVVAWSAGKDSSALLALVLESARRLREEGGTPAPIVVSHSDTGVENPAVSRLARSELAKVTQFATRHRLDVNIVIAGPALVDHFAVRVLGGRRLPSFAVSNRDCTVDFKIRPQARARGAIVKHLKARGFSDPVVVTGSRYEESEERRRRMTARGDSHATVQVSPQGEQVLTPIANWRSDDVFEFLAVWGHDDRTYSDFRDTLRLYADAGGSTCAVVADAVTENWKQSRPCSARFGCVTCTVVQADRSLGNLSADPAYGYLRGWLAFRDFLINTQWDFSRRNWIGRTIRDGYVRIAPDVYSPAMVQELLRYALTLDADEAIAAEHAGLPGPRFQMIDAAKLIAIDAYWSLLGIAPPFAALRVFRDVYVRGSRYQVPSIEAAPRRKMPTPRYLYVGKGWDAVPSVADAGMSDSLLDAFGGEGCLGHRHLADGRRVLDLHGDRSFAVDDEAAQLILSLELDRLLDGPPLVSPAPGAAYRYYASIGCLSLSPGQFGLHDMMLRRTAYRLRHGFDASANINALLARTISQTDYERCTGQEAANEADAQLALALAS